MKVSDEVEARIRHLRNRAYSEKKLISADEDRNPFETDLALSYLDGYIKALGDFEKSVRR